MAFPIVKGLLSAKKISDSIKIELEKVDQLVSAQVEAFDPKLAPYMEYICQTSGKRLRPILGLLIGGACGNLNADHVKLGAIVELVHMSSLVHDDVLDEADVRRGVPTPNAEWGNYMAVLLGDALFAHTMMLSTEFDSLSICKELGKATRDVCEGEVMQSQHRYDINLTQDEYFKIVEKKTAALFAVVASVSAQLAGMDAKVVGCMRRFGNLLGIAYQIYDDCLDIVGTEDDSGKTMHTDTEKGKLTLPMIYMFDAGCTGFVHRFSAALNDRTPITFQEKEYCPAIARCVLVGQGMTKQARAMLNALPDSSYKTALTNITLYIDELFNNCMGK